jgi:hypothetical protein
MAAQAGSITFATTLFGTSRCFLCGRNERIKQPGSGNFSATCLVQGNCAKCKETKGHSIDAHHKAINGLCSRSRRSTQEDGGGGGDGGGGIKVANSGDGAGNVVEACHSGWKRRGLLQTDAVLFAVDFGVSRSWAGALATDPRHMDNDFAVGPAAGPAKSSRTYQ